MREDEPGLVTAAFIQIFQEGTGDFNDALQPVDFWTWIRHVTLSAGSARDG